VSDPTLASDTELRLLLRLLAPMRAVASPVFSGFEHIPSTRPLLFVGNHTIYGMLDIPLLFAELYLREGIWLRGLGDHLHFAIPGWREFLTRYGVVEGDRARCGALLDAGECVVVFPGGAREVMRRKHERHRLIWKQRIGFAKMALQHHATIVPFAAVGIDDTFDVAFDAGDLEGSRVYALLERVGVRAELFPPIATRVRPQRLYFHVCEPIGVDEFAGLTDDDVAWALRERTAAAIEAGIARLLEQREHDPERALAARMRRLWMG
jgi:1-acyl-sn-glycerol-3-phosphate acyltransferase